MVEGGARVGAVARRTCAITQVTSSEKILRVADRRRSTACSAATMSCLLRSRNATRGMKRAPCDVPAWISGAVALADSLTSGQERRRDV